METLKQICIKSGKYCWYCWGNANPETPGNCDKHVSKWLIEYKQKGIIK